MATPKKTPDEDKTADIKNGEGKATTVENEQAAGDNQAVQKGEQPASVSAEGQEPDRESTAAVATKSYTVKYSLTHDGKVYRGEKEIHLTDEQLAVFLTDEVKVRPEAFPDIPPSIYIVKSAINHDGEDYGVGHDIELSDKHAAPLLAVGAISAPSAAAGDEAA